MLTVAYLANQFPSKVEPYVTDEIAELRRRGVRVIAGSVRTPSHDTEITGIVLQPGLVKLAPAAIWLCIAKWLRILPLLLRVLASGRETLWQRFRALLHTFLGLCYAALLRDCQVDHIHVHHGFFASWIAMTAARVLDIPFSMTLHGSDLLLHGAYLDLKLAACKFCFTVSEYNRNYILQRFPDLNARKVIVSRLGVEVGHCELPKSSAGNSLNLLGVGRLHTVKNHAFLIRSCAELRTRGVQFHCRIAGDGPERPALESLIRRCQLQECVTLLGHVERARLQSLYDQADAVVLTSRSEGIPLVLMEAMARGKLVLAPAITGIPELITPGETGFLYEPGSLADCVAHLQFVDWLIRTSRDASGCGSTAAKRKVAGYAEHIRQTAIEQIQRKFNREKNLERFGDRFLEQVSAAPEARSDAHLVLQQI
jgi:colanic acid/amylovoran biosynthesis glycosyltransferase